MPAQSPLRAGGREDFELIETFRYEPERGFIRLDLHLGRMAASAETFGFPFDAAHVNEKLQVLADPHEMRRIRVALNAQGGVKVTHQPYVPRPAETVWRLKIAKTRLDSRDPLLRHKTSRRETYNAARAEFLAQEADEVLLLNEKGEVSEGTITTLFVQEKEGGLLTPSLECGLLQGVLRQELIETGQAREAWLTPDKLATAVAIFVGNSLRDLIRVRLFR